MVIRWRSDFDKYCIVSNFEKRRWAQSDGGEWDAWNIYWASVQTVHRLFQPENGGGRLESHQLINHFPNHHELTRKDCLVKNIKRHQRTVKREGEPLFEFLPTTYVLPADHPLFVEEFKRQPEATWIMKPAGRAQVCSKRPTCCQSCSAR